MCLSNRFMFANEAMAIMHLGEMQLKAAFLADLATLEARRVADLATREATIDAAHRAKTSHEVRLNDIAMLEATVNAAEIATLEVTRLSDLATLEATRVAEVATREALAARYVATLQSMRFCDLATLAAKRVADLATLEAKRVADLATLEATVNAARRAETATHEATRVDDLATLEAAVDAAEIATLEVKRVADLATLEATRVAEVATREVADVARLAEIARLEALRLADLATSEATRLADLATLDAKRLADLATLEATRLAELATFEARRAERHFSESHTSHELKNRLMAMEELCSLEEPPLAQVRALIASALEAIKTRSVVLQLVSGSYAPQPEDIVLETLFSERLQRFNGASSEAATPRGSFLNIDSRVGSLRLDRILVTLVIDTLLSNAFKYGDATLAPRVDVRVDDASALSSEQREEGLVLVCCEVRNAAGPDHAHLLELGENELNTRAATGCHSESTGGSFSRARACAKLLGGTVRLSLTPLHVCATLTLPHLARAVPVAPRLVEDAERVARLSAFTTAIVDDSRINCRMLERIARKAFPLSAREPFVAGLTLTSIETFACTVVALDSDVVLVDQNFGIVCQVLFGTDLVRKIRALDREAERTLPRIRPRLIFVVSANDAPCDLLRYQRAGADGHIPKNVGATRLREIIYERALY